MTKRLGKKVPLGDRLVTHAELQRILWAYHELYHGTPPKEKPKVA